MYVCMYVCMYVYWYVCVCICVCICIYRHSPINATFHSVVLEYFFSVLFEELRLIEMLNNEDKLEGFNGTGNWCLISP